MSQFAASLAPQRRAVDGSQGKRPARAARKQGYGVGPLKRRAVKTARLGRCDHGSSCTLDKGEENKHMHSKDTCKGIREQRQGGVFALVGKHQPFAKWSAAAGPLRAGGLLERVGILDFPYL